MCFPKANVPSPEAQAAEVRKAEEERSARVRATSGEVNKVFDEKYGPQYYEGIGTAFKNYYAPQVADQFNDASRATKFRFAENAGSSAANRTSANLYRDKLRADSDVNAGAFDAANNARQDVEAKRSNLIGLAEAGGSLENTAALARNAATSNLGQPTFSPIGDLFGKYANTLSTTARAADAGQQTNPFYQKQVDFLRGRSGSQKIVGG
jgi:hypothetical protein